MFGEDKGNTAADIFSSSPNFSGGVCFRTNAAADSESFEIERKPGDGRTEAAVYRDRDRYMRQSANGFASVQFGLANDKPIPTAYLP